MKTISTYCLFLYSTIVLAQESKNIIIPFYNYTKELYGFCDTSENIIINPLYSEIADIKIYHNNINQLYLGALFIAYLDKEQKKYHVINNYGKIVLSNANYDYVNLDYQNIDLMFVIKNDKYGVWYKNKEIIKCEYNFIENAAFNKLLVHKTINNHPLYGLSDYNGKIIIEPKYNIIYPYFIDSAILAWVGITWNDYKATSTIFYDSSYNKTPYNATWWNVKANQLKHTIDSVEEQRLMNNLGINTERLLNNFVINIEETDTPKNTDTIKGIISQLNRKYNTLIDISYHFLELDNDSIIQINGIINYKGKMGIYNLKSNREIIPMTYDHIHLQRSINNKLLFLVTLDKKEGLINENNKFILPIEYDDIDIYDSLIIVQKNEKYGLFNMNKNRFIYECVYDKIALTANSDTNYVFIKITQNNKTTLLNLNLDVLINNKYLSVSYFNDTIFKVTIGAYVFSSDYAVGLYNIKTKKEILKPLYSSIYSLSDINGNPAFFLVSKNINGEELYGVLDNNLNEVISCKYQNISETDYYGYYKTERDGYYGIYKIGDTALIIPTKYDNLDHEFLIRLNKNKTFMIFKTIINNKDIFISENKRIYLRE
ncbi:MAG TPA: WG repeat-containing protein [Chitinophagales bacterium]|nr:WG repeat-containing protein [Chitinophagales bacterium]